MTTFRQTNFIPHEPIWELRQVYTQDNAGGGNIIIEISPGVGQRMMIKHITLGPDDYGASRTATLDIFDSAGNRKYLLNSAGIDNARITYPSRIGTASSATLKNLDNLVISDNNVLKIGVLTLAQAETVTISIECYLRSTITPTIDFSDSTGTVAAPTTAYNRLGVVET